jgi:hypothetical protein
MNKFEYFRQFKATPNAEEDENKKHIFFPVQNHEIAELEKKIRFPAELKHFYQKIGYGIMFQNSNKSFMGLLHPRQVYNIYSRNGDYKKDYSLDVYECLYLKTKAVFFSLAHVMDPHILSGAIEYLAIDLNDSIHTQNSIFYFDKKISDSLEEFLLAFDRNSDLLDEFRNQ